MSRPAKAVGTPRTGIGPNADTGTKSGLSRDQAGTKYFIPHRAGQPSVFHPTILSTAIAVILGVAVRRAHPSHGFRFDAGGIWMEFAFDEACLCSIKERHRRATPEVAPEVTCRCSGLPLSQGRGIFRGCRPVLDTEVRDRSETANSNLCPDPMARLRNLSRATFVSSTEPNTATACARNRVSA